MVREFARMFEGTYEVNRLLPLGIDPKPEKGQEYFVAKLHATKEDYLKDGGIKGSAGIYSSGAKAIKVPLGSALSSLLTPPHPDHGLKRTRQNQRAAEGLHQGKMLAEEQHAAG